MTSTEFHPDEAALRHSSSFGELAKALVEAQVDLPTVTKDSVNPHFRNKYASLDAVVEAVRGPLAKHGLAVVQGAVSPNGGAALTVETMLVHASGEWLSSSVVVPMAKIDPQGAGGALTYGRRYGLAALLSLATETDDDAQARPQAAAPSAAAQPVPQPKPKSEPKATKAQIADIAALISVLVADGTNPDEIEKWMLDTYNTVSASELTKIQATDLFVKLKRRTEGIQQSAFKVPEGAGA